MPVVEQEQPLDRGVGLVDFGGRLGQTETGHDVGHDAQPVAEDLARRFDRIGQVGQDQERRGMGMVHVSVRQEGVQQRLNRRVGGGAVQQVLALDVDHGLVRQCAQIAQRQQRGQAHPRQAGRQDGVQIPARALDVQHLLHPPEQVGPAHLDRGIATAMHDQIGVAADDPAGIDPQGEITFCRIVAGLVEPDLRLGVGPSVGDHRHQPCARSGNIAAMPSAVAGQTPRSVISPVTSRAGVTSKAGLPTRRAVGRHPHLGDRAVGGGALHMGDLAAVAFLDRDFADAVGHRPVDGGRRQRHVERHAVVMGGQRLEVGADLVADIALPGGAVGAGDDHVDQPVLHQMAAGIVGHVLMCGRRGCPAPRRSAAP